MSGVDTFMEIDKSDSPAVTGAQFRRSADDSLPKPLLELTLDRSGDRLTFLPALALGLSTMGFILAKTGRDAMFFQGDGGLARLPLIYINIAAAALPLAMIFVQAMKTWGARPARIGVLMLAAIVLTAGAPFLQPGDNAPMLAIFMFIPAVFGILFASLWLLASDLFEGRDKRATARAFSRIGAATLSGGMIGGILAKGLAPHLDPKWLLVLAGAVIASVAMLVRYIHSRYPTEIAPQSKGKVNSGLFAPFQNRYALTLLLISATGALAGLLIDFQFYAAAVGARMGATGNSHFFANFYILLNFSSLLLQLFATPKIQEKIGLRGGLMILPVALIGGATFAAAAATALSRSVLRVTEGGLRSSVHRSLWEQAFIPLNPIERSSVKLLVDGVAARLAEVVGAVVILLWLREAAPGGIIRLPLDTGWMSWAILATVVIWLLVTHALRVMRGREEATRSASLQEVDCERFPDQCPCTTELGKGIR